MSIYTRHDPEGSPSFITTNTHERRPLFDEPRAAALLVETLYEIRTEVGVLVLAFAVMPDHLHLIAVPPPRQLGRTLQLIKGRFARSFNRNAGRAGPVWQARYHERTLRSEAALSKAIQYVEHNPVAAGLASEPGAYPWSSANERYKTDLSAYFGQAEA